MLPEMFQKHASVPFPKYSVKQAKSTCAGQGGGLSTLLPARHQASWPVCSSQEASVPGPHSAFRKGCESPVLSGRLSRMLVTVMMLGKELRRRSPGPPHIHFQTLGLTQPPFPRSEESLRTEANPGLVPVRGWQEGDLVIDAALMTWSPRHCELRLSHHQAQGGPPTWTTPMLLVTPRSRLKGPAPCHLRPCRQPSDKSEAWGVLGTQEGWPGAGSEEGHPGRQVWGGPATPPGLGLQQRRRPRGLCACLSNLPFHSRPAAPCRATLVTPGMSLTS